MGTDRHVVVVGVQATGLYPGHHVCVEVAWWDLTTDERGHFVPHHTVSAALAGADIKSLRLNRYVDRIAGQPQDCDGVEARRLSDVLHEQTVAGSNPAFDAAFLLKMFVDVERRDQGAIPNWHHRLWDLSAYAAGALGLDHLPGLAEVCERLDIHARPDHTAEADVTAAGLCFRALFARAGLVS
ncbi:MAG: hypothetical protein ACRDRX_04540 [Pseudonocardiaceae bacterium]